ncbi:Nucleoid occlusion protein [subsurface metagenome]
MTIKQIPLDAIDDSPYQCRSSYSTTVIEELAHSIKEIGLRQIPEARQVDGNGRYQLAYGHLRFRAFKKLAKQDKTIKTMPLDVKEIPDNTMCLLSLEENMRRQDITPIDIARSIDLYMTTFKDSTETELARRLKMTQGHVSNMRRVLRLPKEILDKIEEGKINFTMARELLIFEGKTGIGKDHHWDRLKSQNVASPRNEKWLMISAVNGRWPTGLYP